MSIPLQQLKKVQDKERKREEGAALVNGSSAVAGDV